MSNTTLYSRKQYLLFSDMARGVVMMKFQKVQMEEKKDVSEEVMKKLV